MEKITENINQSKVKEYFDQVTEGKTPTVEISSDEYETGLEQVLSNMDEVLADAREEVAKKRMGDIPEAISFSYIAKKTSRERVDAIEVPLNSIAKAILEKYWDGQRKTGPLLPFISPQKYNDSIKEIFLLCGITRNVTIWNSTTGKEEQHPLNEIASSHLARRTFIGNLYKKVQDPNMIGKLSGHVEGSKAFARYRTIDDDMKQNMVKMLE